ncbi:MAG: FixH family protein [Gammaproteobacteria bacterium]|nr:FixH family protein [Gammaproteobacteria bacterium]
MLAKRMMCAATSASPLIGLGFNPTPFCMNSPEKKPWYSYPIMWLIVAIPLSAVFVGSYLMYLSIVTFDGLVEDDYYQKGKDINLDLARDDFAAEKGIQANITISAETGVVSVALTAAKEYAFPDPLGLAFLHPTQSNQDRKLLLQRGPDGRYFAELNKPLKDGRWYARVSEPNWRLQKRFVWPETKALELRP